MILVPGRGRPSTSAASSRELVCRTAKTAPQQLRLPFTTWSLAKLADYLGEHYRLVISAETIRMILRDDGITCGQEGPHPGADPTGRLFVVCDNSSWCSPRPTHYLPNVA